MSDDCRVLCETLLCLQSIMYHIATKRVLFRIICNDRGHEERYIDIAHNTDENSLLNLTAILTDFANREVFPIKAQLFYLDPLTDRFVYADFLKKEIRLSTEFLRKHPSVQPNKEVAPENYLCVTLMIKNISDETLANPMRPEKKRSKERVISDVITYCKEWRRIYRGASENSGNKLTLDDSAGVIGISRKTLEDYYLHLRNGKKLGFDFLKFKDSKMGVLRNFVRQNLKKNNECSSICTKESKKEQNKVKLELEELQERELFESIEATQLLGKEGSTEMKGECVLQQQYDIGQYLILGCVPPVRSDSSSDSQA